MQYDYNPFGKTFDDIASEDLQSLLTVAEGWYVEYKQEVLNAGAIAKSVTAFANTYGGWLFFGVAEESKDNPVAGTFPGIAAADADGFLQRIRQAVANHTQPSPFFRVKALCGPVDAIGLSEGRCVIIGHVPWGPEAPYIHKDGRIYRRVGDGSEPKNENDRFVLDQLWNRSSKIIQKYSAWIDRELEVSQAEEKTPYLRLFFIADFWQDHGPLNLVSLRRVREIMSGTTGFSAVPFDNIYRSSGGFVCRQTANNDPEKLGLTWKLSNSYQSEIIVPLSKFQNDDLDKLRMHFAGYDHFDQFLKICVQQRYMEPTIIDLNILFHVLIGISRAQLALADEFGWRGPFYAKMAISGVWRTVPFLDIRHVVDAYDQHGIPLGLHDMITVLPGDDQRSFVELVGSGVDKDNDNDNRTIFMATRLFIYVAIALGLPVDVDLDGDASDGDRLIEGLYEAGLRAIKGQENR